MAETSSQSTAQPDRFIREMRESDLHALHGLTVEVGWPHRLEEWRFALEVGHGVVAADSAGRIYGSAMWWPFGQDAGAVGMVIVSPRLQAKGTGRLLMRAIFDQAGDRSLRLTATKAGRRLYEDQGFLPLGHIRQFQGVAANVADDANESFSGKVRPMKPGDEVALLALDRGATGVDRSVALRAALGRSTGFVCERGGDVVGFALCRAFGRGRLLGPMVAEDDAMAIALARPHVEANVGGFFRADTAFYEGDYAAFLARAGLAEVDSGLVMGRGAEWRRTGAATYALINQALG
ncbi:GNAT family N-acetyltransferase [Terrarubrum flagellatum]|uniref:GNAT family N-acetyltransferase n=1 Tax=Terrirubrum flagellatum TaxID=2895980 RepID=UPI003144F658